MRGCRPVNCVQTYVYPISFIVVLLVVTGLLLLFAWQEGRRENEMMVHGHRYVFNDRGKLVMDIRCDNYASCKSEYLARKTQQKTLDGARAAGWHIWTGTTMGGKHATFTLCPGCARGPVVRIPRSKPLEGDQPLF